MADEQGGANGGDFSAFEALIEERFAERRHATVGEQVFGPAEHREDVCFYLKRGMVNGFLMHENGGGAELFRRGPGTIFPLYYAPDKPSVGAILRFDALTDVELIVMRKAALRALMLEEPRLAVTMVEAYGQFSARLDYALLSRLYDPLSTRVCDYLYLHEVDGTVACSQEHIAHATGGSRPKVAAVLGELRRNGIVITGRMEVRILDRERLWSMCSYMARTGTLRSPAPFGSRSQRP